MRTIRAVLGALSLAPVLAACLPHRWPPLPDQDGMSAPLYGDTILDVTNSLVGNLRMIDSVGRARGALPARLEEAVPARWLHDIFGNALEYSTDGPGFSVRSAGRDRTSGTRDDIYVVGRVGRSVPCELYREGVVGLFEEEAPSCRDVPVTVLPKCRDADYRGVPEYDRRRRRPEERVLATGERLVRIAQQIEGRGRSIGALPPLSSMPGLKLQDAWGRLIDYRPVGHSFELRSAGADGIPRNSDDVVVNSEFGTTILCVFTHAGESRTSGVPSIECP